jgi:Skp family chaperone for outer membrane proteins
MKLKLSAIAIGICLLSALSVANARELHKTRDPGVNTRQHWQHQRIRQGVRSGELTKSEVKDLHEGQKDIRQEEKSYKSDGKLTLDERKDLHQDLNAESKEIYQDKHNDAVQPRLQQ